jgi:hypothetical protein
VSAALQRALQRHLQKLDGPAHPISDILDFIREHGVTLYVNWRSLESLKVDRSTPVTLSLRDLPYASVLDAVLEKADPTKKQSLGWCADENVVVVAARPDLPRYREIKQRLGLRRWDDATRAALDARVPKLRLDAEDLRHAAEIIRQRAGLDIALDVEGLNRCGIDADVPVSLHLTSVTGREVAALLLFELEPRGRLALAPRGGRCVVTPREAFHVGAPTKENNHGS